MKVVSLAAVIALGSVQLVLAANGEWERSLAVGATVTSGNSETTAANASIVAEKAGERNEVRLGAEGNFGESTIDGADETTTENAKASLTYKRKFNGSYLYSDNSLAHDDIADLDYRLIVGGGYGYRVIKTDTAKLGLELGTAYMHEELADDSKDDGILLRASARHDQTLSENAKLWATVEYLPRADDFNDYLINGEAGAEAALSKGLSLRVVIQDRYDSIVPVGRDQNDLSIISAVVCQL